MHLILNIMRMNKLSPIVFFTLFLALVWLQPAARAQTSPLPVDKSITLENQCDPKKPLFFSLTDKTDNDREFEHIENKISFPANTNYVELSQSLDLEPQPVFWCRAGMLYHITGQQRGTAVAQLNCSDPTADHEVGFFRSLSDSLGLNLGGLAYMSQIKDFYKRGIYTQKSKELYDKKMDFLSRYQKTHPVSPQFSEMCRTYFFINYLNNLSFAAKREISRTDSLNKIILDARSKIQNDDLLFSRSYRHFCNSYNWILARQMYHRDSVGIGEMYKCATVNFTGKTKDYLLFAIIRDNLKNKQTDPLLAGFYKECTDETYKSYIRDNLSAKNTTTTNDLLLTPGGVKTTLQQVINRHKGKKIYIDFWASWCSPCRAMMKKSDALHNRYKDKVVFLYISIDKDFSAWKKASKEEQLSDNCSFCISSEAGFLKKYAVKSIPRYMLLDKNGQIITDNAPRPDSAAELDRMVGE